MRDHIERKRLQSYDGYWIHLWAKYCSPHRFASATVDNFSKDVGELVKRGFKDQLPREKIAADLRSLEEKMLRFMAGYQKVHLEITGQKISSFGVIIKQIIKDKLSN